MRGNNRIGWGIGVVGLAVTCLLGVPALPVPLFDGWWVMALLVVVVGLALVGWGSTVLVINSRRQGRKDQRETAARIDALDAQITSIDADLGVHNHWLMVADDYGDHLRAAELRAAIARMTAEKDAAWRELVELRK